ncbi:uncharacterized protein LOC126375216 [Pectinophora gossypiella]|uniref:uncharacterized protein LOC126375216 n=1 Tax=Pectinophora gossypiella TaxID=13191 RepID=UPI00214EB96F|nr:uncharacterized protein LOC126375216 [Pectinophora gossypiella]
MKQALLILLATVAGTYAAASLKVRAGDLSSANYHIPMPLTVAEALAQSWTLTSRPENSLLPSLILYCHESRKACVLYDDTENIAGYQEAFPTDELTDAVYDWGVQGYTKWTPSDDGKVYYATQLYFVTEEYLATSKADRLSSRNASTVLQLDGMWVSGFNGELVKLPKNFEEDENTDFTKQVCSATMGYHYYYKFSKDLVCSAETLFPWFPMAISGRLVSLGVLAYGKMPEQDFDVCERYSRAVTEYIAPAAPECFYDLADSPGILSTHIFFDLDDPSAIQCPSS